MADKEDFAMLNGRKDACVIIPSEEYKELLEESEFLAYLHALGVENWEGYEYAVESLEKSKCEIESESDGKEG